MAKIHKFQGDITKEVANSLKESIAIDTEATGLQIPDKISSYKTTTTKNCANLVFHGI